jgi:hypothetical protein
MDCLTYRLRQHSTTNRLTMNRILFLIPGLLCLVVCSHAVDYVELKDGRQVAGAILRQDTIAVYMTEWNLRSEQFPPLQVFGRDEIRAIWFDDPGHAKETGISYRPQSKRFELGGGTVFQTWQQSDQDRRYVLQMSLFGGMSISPVFGLEVDADLTFPWGDENTPQWHDFDASHQVSMNVVAHLPWKHKIIPYVIAGGGSSEGVPIDGVLLTKSSKAHDMVHAGVGIKYGMDGLGFRLELRHSYYAWEEEQTQLDPEDFNNVIIRRLNMDADATVLRATIFGYF